MFSSYLWQLSLPTNTSGNPSLDVITKNSLDIAKCHLGARSMPDLRLVSVKQFALRRKISHILTQVKIFYKHYNSLYCKYTKL